MINTSNSHSSSNIVNEYFKHKWIIYVALPRTKWLLLNGKIYTVFHLRKEQHPLWTTVWSIGLLFLKLFDVVHTWLQNTYNIIEYRNECVKLSFFSGQIQTNPVTTSQDNNELFVAGILSVVIALITTILWFPFLYFVVSFNF